MASVTLPMDQTTMLLVFTLSVSVLILASWLRPKHKGPFPPGPPAQLFWGNWEQIVKSSGPGTDPKWKIYRDWVAKYGAPA